MIESDRRYTFICDLLYLRLNSRRYKWKHIVTAATPLTFERMVAESRRTMLKNKLSIGADIYLRIFSFSDRKFPPAQVEFLVMSFCFHSHWICKIIYIYIYRDHLFFYYTIQETETSLVCL